jgi:hypothetical protein
MTFEVQVMGRDVFVRPSDDTWRTMRGSDGRDWIELNSDQARMLANALSLTDRFTVTADEEDG